MPIENRNEGAAETETEPHGAHSPLKARGRTLEVTGLGIIAALVLAFGTLVSDGTLPLAQYLIFLSLMLVSAGGMLWRIWRLTPERIAAPGRLQPGVYRVSFGGQAPSRR